MKNLLYILLFVPLALFGQEPTPISYQLSSGWNMVGFTGCEITPIDEAFQNALENGATISETFNIIKDVRGEFWHSSLGEYSSLTQLTPGEGYMMYVQGGSTTVQFSDIYCDDITYQLNSGWNMLAYTGTPDNNGIVEQIDAALGNGVGTANTFMVLKNVYGQFWSAAYSQINTLNPGQAYMMYVSGAPTTLSFTGNSTQVFENNPGVEFTLPTTDNNMSIVFSAGLLDDFIGQEIYAEINGHIVSEYTVVNENGSVGLAVIGAENWTYNVEDNYWLAENGDVLNFVILIDNEALVYIEPSSSVTYTSNGEEIISVININGCTDISACNYEFYATTNDGSCLYLDYEQSLFNACCLDNSISTICLLEDVTCESVDCINLGCMETWADNYDPFVTEDDGTCYRYGCTLDWADNLDVLATINDGSCFHTGCSETWADNYDSIATINDTTCYKFGCTQSWADNYDDYSTINDTTCFLHGCNSICAENFDENATINDGTCILIGVDESNDYLNYVNTSLYDALLNWNPSIDLNAGWNMFGYGCPNPISVIEGISNHTESIILVKDNNGSVYMSEFDFNGIGDLTPGFGYQIKLTEAIEGFSLCDWYVNDIPEDNIVSLQEELAELQELNNDILSSNNNQCVENGYCGYNLELLACYHPEVGFACNGDSLDLYLGQEAYGGIVFYIDETGEHGLVGAIEDLGNLYWGCFSEEIVGADGVEIGTGYQNTLDIAVGCSETPIAASEALAYESGGYSDWYLPSIDELVEMYSVMGNGGSFQNSGNQPNYYGSSSEADYDSWWLVNFIDGVAQFGGGSNKHNSFHARVIRSF
jgi:hypothetical protein